MFAGEKDRRKVNMETENETNLDPSFIIPFIADATNKISFITMRRHLRIFMNERDEYCSAQVHRFHITIIIIIILKHLCIELLLHHISLAGKWHYL